MSTPKPSRTLRKKGKTPESVNLSFVNQRKLAYNILKNLEDDILGDKEIPELDQCSECNNEILTRPPKAFSILSCGHVFHRICVEKKLLLTMPNTCPFPDCGKNVDIIEPSPTTNQESPISALSNRMDETFILSSPILRVEGIENTGFQQARSYLKCAKCSEDLSSWLPPISSIRFPLQPQGPSKHLVYLTCKHIVHYACIDNPRKLCPICPSTDMEPEEEMEIDDDEIVTDAQGSSTTQKKRTRKSTTERSSSKKKKTTNKDDVSTMVKTLIEELLTNNPNSDEVLEETNASSNTDEHSRMKFLYLSDMIDQAETKNRDATQNVINRYFDFGEALYLRYKELKPSGGKDGAKALVKEEVRKQIPETKFSDDALRKRMERAGKVYKLFNSIGRTKIARIRSFPARSILNLSDSNVDRVLAGVLRAERS
jgi:hypothetical protein